eukprot:2067025-Amphidinium_carterae.1
MHTAESKATRLSRAPGRQKRGFPQAQRQQRKAAKARRAEAEVSRETRQHRQRQRPCNSQVQGTLPSAKRS